MDKLFKIIENRRQEEGRVKGICIGLDIKIAERNLPFPVSETCRSFSDLEKEVKNLQEGLGRLLEEAKGFFEESATGEELELAPNMEPEEIWSILSTTKDDALFVRRFNSLDDEKRREVAEYVLTQCNIFSGMGAVFSARYDNEKGIME